MSRVSKPHLVSILGLLGSILLIVGLFLPLRTTISSAPPHTIESLSFGQFLVALFTFHLDLLQGTWIVSFLLVIFSQILASFTELAGSGKRAFFVQCLALAIFGLLNFLYASYVIYCLFYCGGYLYRLRGITHVLGLGFWLMLCGFLVSICSSTVQIMLFKPHATTIELPARRRW